MYECRHESMCYAAPNGNRSFLTTEEKLEMLKEYKETLDKESKGVAEKIVQLSKGK